jgi:hypothetical protein
MRKNQKDSSDPKPFCATDSPNSVSLTRLAF